MANEISEGANLGGGNIQGKLCMLIWRAGQENFEFWRL